MESPTENAMVLRGSSIPAPWEEGFAPTVWRTVSPEAALRAINDAIPGVEMLDKPFKLVNIVIHSITLTDPDTGEETVAPRTILIDEKAHAYAFVSKGVVSSLSLLCSLLDRKPPFDPPIAVKVIQLPIKGGFRVYRLTLA